MPKCHSRVPKANCFIKFAMLAEVKPLNQAFARNEGKLGHIASTHKKANDVAKSSYRAEGKKKSGNHTCHFCTILIEDEGEAVHILPRVKIKGAGVIGLNDVNHESSNNKHNTCDHSPLKQDPVRMG